MMRPSPRHVGQGATVTNWPKNDRWARRTSPMPEHVLHVSDLEPGSAPEPAHLSQGSRTLILIFLSTPVATSASDSGTVTLRSAPDRGPEPPALWPNSP